MTEKIYVNHTANLVREILRQMHQDSWKPDYIVGITRGGLEPANMISQYLEIPMQALNISLRDSTMGPESNLWMAEDAYRYLWIKYLSGHCSTECAISLYGIYYYK